MAITKGRRELAMIGKSIRGHREDRGWSQEELADRAGLDRTYVGGIERGRRNVAVLNLIKLARALHVPPSELLRELEGA